MVGDATETSTFGADTEHSAASYIIKRDWSCVYMNPIWSRTLTVLQMCENPYLQENSFLGKFVFN